MEEMNRQNYEHTILRLNRMISNILRHNRMDHLSEYHNGSLDNLWHCISFMIALTYLHEHLRAVRIVDNTFVDQKGEGIEDI